MFHLNQNVKVFFNYKIHFKLWLKRKIHQGIVRKKKTLCLIVIFPVIVFWHPLHIGATLLVSNVHKFLYLEKIKIKKRHHKTIH